nr:CAP domain-containing protein [Thiospirochaeta perfilievii]
MNLYRQEKGLNTLVSSENLLRSSKNHLDYLVSRSIITHKGKMGDSLEVRVKNTGVTSFYYGEVVGYSTSLDKLLDSWIDSEPHNRVLLDQKWNFIGISNYFNGKSYISVVNFSSGILGSTTIKYFDDKIILNGVYIDKPNFKGDFKIISSLFKDNQFEIEIIPNKKSFFIYVYDSSNKLTDRVDVFLKDTIDQL